MRKKNSKDAPLPDGYGEKLEAAGTALGFSKNVMEKIPAIIYLRDCHDGGVKWCNRATEEILGYSSEKIIALGNHFWERVAHPDDLYLAEYSSRHYITNRSNFGGVVRLRTTYSEDWRWFVGISTIFATDDEGRALQTLVVHIDFTAAINTFPHITEALRRVMNHRYKDMNKIISDREKEIIRMVLQGYSSSQIGQKLHLSRHTINSHRKNIKNKLNVKNTAELAVVAEKIGIH